MPVGRRLAYDAIHGRLWVVCPRCGEWNLTPLDDRWEAIEECERLFSSSEARVGSGGVAVAKCDRVELVRLGDAPRDEIANTRYGPRLRRRRTRSHAIAGATALAAGGAVGALVLVVASAATSAAASMDAALVVGAAGVFYCYFFWIQFGKFRMARFRRPEGRVVWLTVTEMQTATVFVRRNNRGKVVSMHLAVSTSRGDEYFSGDDALAALAAMLPVLNAAGATEDEIRRAVTHLDEAEARLRQPKDPSTERRDKKGRTAWQQLLEGHQAASLLIHRTAAERLALEMAVSEELERRELAEHAEAIGTGSARAREVAEIADNMFVPQSVLDWIARFKASRVQPVTPEAATTGAGRRSGTPKSST
jgi:hypothetical protein